MHGKKSGVSIETLLIEFERRKQQVRRLQYWETYSSQIRFCEYLSFCSRFVQYTVLEYGVIDDLTSLLLGDALQWAAFKANEGIVKLLIEHGANVKAPEGTHGQ